MVTRPVRVLVDSTADIPPVIQSELDITVVPDLVHFGQVTYRDGIDLTSDEFFVRLASVTAPPYPTTSSPGPGVFAEAYNELIASGADVIAIHPEANFSSIYGTAVLAARQVPEDRIAVIDSHQITIGTGWLAILAARAARDGAGLAEIVALVQDARARLRLVAVLETVEPLQRSGRMGRLASLVGTLLQIKPIFAITLGEPSLLERPRTTRKARARLLESIRELAPFQELAVMHTAAQAAAESLADDLAAAGIHPREQIMVAQAGAAMGTHVGVGAVAVVGLVLTGAGGGV
ncbi:MAG: DegV family protein [Chloroflexi bacterium]|nr:DegV family protein [Chloroflexota bacterium]MBU1746563.1 DegV family protein [Chloroflexota bacterium]MBU1878609.1 DegV family protein [Chloroflexota bacterium]